MTTMTPGAYVAKIRKYPVGDPRRKLAEQRAALAIRAARAGRAGDMATAGRALAGLDALARFGDVDVAALSARISSGIAARTNSLSPDTRATAMGTRVAGTTVLIASLVASVVNIIAYVTADPGIQMAARWVDLILRGEVHPTWSERDLREMSNACAVWNGGVKAGVMALQAVLAGGSVVASFTTAAGGTTTATTPPARPDNTLRIVNELIGYIVFAIDTICTNVVEVFPPTNATNWCVAPGGSTNSSGQPATASDCCEGLVFDPSDGRCKHPRVELTAIQAAFQRWYAARARRAAVERDLLNPTAPSAGKAAATLDDEASSVELCEAEKALLEFRDPIPARGVAPSQEQLARTLQAIAGERMTDTFGNAFLIQALVNYAPASAVPRCYLYRPPAGGCSCRRPQGGAGGGGGGIVLFALPAAAALWYMMK